ncbi:MAG: sporulation protein YqfD [Clostridia bacterium]|nr:sporulation protein YqfD [Clostridia bacterium]
MLSRFRLFLVGWREFYLSKDDRSAAFDLMFCGGISFSRERERDGRVSFRVRESCAAELCSLLEGACIEYALGEVHGLPALVRWLFYRPAIPIGAALFLIWMLYSSRLIWDVRVFGNTKTSEAEIIALLDELGCGIGDYYPSIEFSKVHANYAAAQNDIAWLSVYMNGTVAEVQVRELWADTRPRHEAGVSANVVATCDGIVESVNVFEGQAAVRAGDLVREGQVLISGVVENKDGSVRYEYAAGEVYCTVAEPISVKIEPEREKKVYTGRFFSKKSVKIFKKTINLFGKGGIEGATYDTIDTMEQLCPFGLGTIPIWISKTEYREYVTERETVSPEDAAEYVMMELSREIKARASSGTMLSKSVEISADESGYRLDCLLYLSRDVGKTLEFKISGADEISTSGK